MRGATVEHLENKASVIRISIHAPMRGATEYLDSEAINKELISIHAPMRGATKCRRSNL